MLEGAFSYVWGQFKAAKPAFLSKKPHFSFITVHYFWIIGATIVGSIAIFAGGKGELAYIDALMFASGANTQAGLNPVDVNRLNGFQQAMIYLFAITSNPITLHGCVVFLRLYWFEKRFRSWVREIRSRRRTLTKSKSQAQSDVHLAEQGVNGRNITLMPHNGRKQRITNDGILLEDSHEHPHNDPVSNKSEESDTTTGTDDQLQLTESNIPEKLDDQRQNHEVGENQRVSLQGHTAITFADTVKRSDGLGDEDTKFPQKRAHAEHIAILERQRNQNDDEVLRIPGPRDAERGLGPRRLEASDMDEDDIRLARSPTAETFRSGATHPGRIRERQSTIVITEPEKHHRREEIEEDVKAAGGTMDALRFRKPRIFNRSQNKYHDDEDPRPVRAVRTRTLETIRSVLSSSKTEDMPYLSYTPTMGRNSNFVGLTLEQREELGGIEYRSLRTLAIVLLAYFWGFHLVILACLLPFILHDNHYGDIVVADGVSRTWWGFFTSNVAFMDVGFTLTPDSMISFNTSAFCLMVMWFFIIIGNTGFPVMLRFIIWVAAKLAPVGSGVWEELRFLLDHPRRCFTLLFPSGPNWWLFWILVALNAIDLLFFMVLDLGGEPIARLSVSNRVVIGFFQAASTRTAGFSAVAMSEIHPAIPVLYLIMMYISVFPIAISIRRTNVYEEKSLGMYQPHTVEDDQDASALSYVGTHLRRQLSFDLWYVFLGFFIITISEGAKIVAGRFSLFDILFEVVSAYGTVGLSMGAAGVNASLCSQFSVVGKLVIVAMEIRGRHRGLPYGLDRAVLLPSESRFRKEAEEQEAVLARTNTAITHATASGIQRQDTNLTRTRSKSRERGRANSNIVAQFLHPGPVVHREGSSHQRMSSSDSQGHSLGPMRTFSEPNPADDEQMDELAPLPSAGSRPQNRRAESTPVF
ncbi:potassium transporter [Metarhizium rileyi]|uniref:Potassium transport protein n=1 Tax=Metarhizium rileyi (strain RCEF 4871) TaxID=1649241 RepID=A0A166ZPY9_METRR|nr:potassium transporter [Metarhizium rileyi RCEF 4871]